MVPGTNIPVSRVPFGPPTGHRESHRTFPVRNPVLGRVDEAGEILLSQNYLCESGHGTNSRVFLARGLGVTVWHPRSSFVSEYGVFETSGDPERDLAGLARLIADLNEKVSARCGHYWRDYGPIWTCTICGFRMARPDSSG